MGNSGKVNIVTIIVIAVFVFGGLFAVGTTFAIMFSGLREVNREISVNPDEYDTEVNATIVDFSQSESSMGKGTDVHVTDVYNPIYRYEYNGETYTASGNIATSEKKYEIGDEVIVRISSAQPDKMYDPNFNAKSELNSFMADAGKMMFISTMAGIFFIVIVIGLTVLAIRKKMENPHVVYTESADISEDYNQEN